jgi:hypothetical protein
MTDDQGCDVGLGGVSDTPGSVEVITWLFGSGFLAFFGVLGGSILGALFLASVLGELRCVSLAGV